MKLAEEGKLHNVNPTVATFSLLGMIVWISRWYRPDGGLSAEEALKDLLRISLGAMLKNPHSATDVAGGRNPVLAGGTCLE